MSTEILFLCDYYLPGFRAGGGLRSVANLVALLEDEHRFRIITRNRDYTCSAGYADVPTGVWVPRGRSEVRYLTPRDLRAMVLWRLLRSTSHDVLYLNSVLSPSFSVVPLLLRLLRLVPRTPVIVAANGELSPHALRIKPWKKRFYLAVARLLGLYRPVVWRASDETEAQQVRRVFGGDATVVVARNVPPTDWSDEPASPRPPKRPGELRVVYVSRISSIKNLSVALEAMRGLEGRVDFDIYGPKDEPGYWAECERIIGQLPDNVNALHHDALLWDNVPQALNGCDLFFLPSSSESFGYSILEALGEGVPVLISDRTPWRELEQAGVGWDLPLDTPERFASVLQDCIEMPESEHRLLRESARAYARRQTPDVEAYRALLTGR